MPGLEAMRLYAALLIILFHLVHIPGLELPGSLHFIATHFGFGVPLFYVISAFGLFLGYQGKLRFTKEWRDYYLRRFFRIAPLFYFMLIAYIPFLWVLFDGYRVPLEKVISSALFIFNFIPNDVEGYVWASWSIGVEMVFYLILPILIFAIKSLRSAILFLALTVYIKHSWSQPFNIVADNAALLNFENYFILSHLHYFAMGIVAYFVWRKLWLSGCNKPAYGRVITVVGVAGSVIWIGFQAMLMRVCLPWVNTLCVDKFNEVILVGFMSLIVIGQCVSASSILVNRGSCVLGKASFSLYLWHPVVIGILMQTGVYKVLYANVSSVYLSWLSAMAVTLLILLPVAIASYRHIEVPGMKMARRFIS